MKNVYRDISIRNKISAEYQLKSFESQQWNLVLTEKYPLKIKKFI